MKRIIPKAPCPPCILFALPYPQKIRDSCFLLTPTKYFLVYTLYTKTSLSIIPRMAGLLVVHKLHDHKESKRRHEACAFNQTSLMCTVLFSGLPGAVHGLFGTILR